MSKVIVEKKGAHASTDIRSGKYAPVYMNLSGEAGKRVIKAARNRVMARHAKAIERLAYK